MSLFVSALAGSANPASAAASAAAARYAASQGSSSGTQGTAGGAAGASPTGTSAPPGTATQLFYFLFICHVHDCLVVTLLNVAVVSQ